MGICKACEIAQNPGKIKNQIRDIGGWWFNKPGSDNKTFVCKPNIFGVTRKRRSLFNLLFK